MAEETAKEVLKKERKRKPKVFVARGKRKRAIARASISAGTGKITFNGVDAFKLDNSFVKQIVLEPVEIAGGVGSYDLKVWVQGGGNMGQAQAARTAIARALVGIAGDTLLKKKFSESDRSLLVEDPRRVEPKKFKGPKARARFTKSYR